MMVTSLRESDGKLDSGYILKVEPTAYSDALMWG